MGKSPKHPTPVPTHGSARTLWIKHGNRIKWIAAVVAATTSAIIGVAKSWEYVEPKLLAHRGYVREISDDSKKEYQSSEGQLLLKLNALLSAQKDSQIEQAEGKRDAAKEAKAKWTAEVSKTQDPVTRNLYDQHINELDATIDKLNRQIRQLNSTKDR